MIFLGLGLTSTHTTTTNGAEDDFYMCWRVLAQNCSTAGAAAAAAMLVKTQKYHAGVWNQVPAPPPLLAAKVRPAIEVQMRK